MIGISSNDHCLSASLVIAYYSVYCISRCPSQIRYSSTLYSLFLPDTNSLRLSQFDSTTQRPVTCILTLQNPCYPNPSLAEPFFWNLGQFQQNYGQAKPTTEIQPPPPPSPHYPCLQANAEVDVPRALPNLVGAP